MTLSFNSLGNFGQIGNQMFQYASLKGIALSNETNYLIPPKEHFGTQYPLRSKLDDCFDIECERGLTNFNTYNEKSFSFQEELMVGINFDLNLHGYFQTEKYFSKYKNEIKKDFYFKEDILNSCLDYLSQHDELISLHIRRTDYVGNNSHPIQPISYYKKALEHIGNDCPVLVFSDDPDWCDQQDFFDDTRFLISRNTPYHDLCLMTFCNYHVIANSSFSWWGAWLSDSKIVIAPKNWFSGEAINNDTTDLYCKNWIVM